VPRARGGSPVMERHTTGLGTVTVTVTATAAGAVAVKATVKRGRGGRLEGHRRGRMRGPQQGQGPGRK